MQGKEYAGLCQPCVKENSVIWGLRNASSPSSLSNKFCYKTKCITDIFIVFFFSIFGLGLLVTNTQWRPWVSALHGIQDMCIWGGSESIFWKKNTQTLGKMVCILAASRFHLTLGALELLSSRMLTVAGKGTNDVPQGWPLPEPQ